MNPTSEEIKACAERGHLDFHLMQQTRFKTSLERGLFKNLKAYDTAFQY